MKIVTRNFSWATQAAILLMSSIVLRPTVVCTEGLYRVKVDTGRLREKREERVLISEVVL